MRVDYRPPVDACGNSLPDRVTTDPDLELLLLIRHFERALLELFAAGEVNGTTHTCLGQEIVPVALAPLVRGDFIFSNHRGHGHYLAHRGDPEGLLAEITGREGAVCSGVGGSQHVHRERYLSTGVQGQSLPVALGVALHYRRTGQDRIAVAYTGDGTWGEGSVYEALNMARLWQAPLLVMVEHNGIAQSTPTGAQMAGDLEGRARAFDIDFHRFEALWVDALRAGLSPVVDRVRATGTPAVVQVDTVRVGPHSKGDDTRSPEELEAVRARDWYPRYADVLGERFAEVDARQRRRVEDLVADVLSRGPSTWDGAPR